MQESREPVTVITDPRAAQLLIDERERAFFNQFLNEPRTVGQLAAELDVERVKVLYRTRKLVKHGLVRVVREEPRAGRPVKHYQATAERFIVPYSASAAAEAADFVAQVEGSLSAAFYESFLPEADIHRIGLEVAAAGVGSNPALSLVIVEDGRWRRLSEVKGDNVNVLHLSILRLDEDVALEMRRELLAVIERFRGREQENGRRHFLRLGIARLRR